MRRSLILALTSATVPTSRIYDIASSVLAQKLSQVEGVGQVNVGGGAFPAVRVELNPKALNKYGISLEHVRTVLARPTPIVRRDSWPMTHKLGDSHERSTVQSREYFR